MAVHRSVSDISSLLKFSAHGINITLSDNSKHINTFDYWTYDINKRKFLQLTSDSEN